MNFNFFLDILILVSLGTVIYILAHTLPRISDEKPKEKDLKTSKVLPYLEIFDNRFKKISEKGLRTCKIMLLKVDNSLSKKLSKFKKENGKNGGFSFNMEDEKQDETEKEKIKES